MAATTLVPIEVYLRTSFRPDADYVDGVIEERNLGQNDHSAWQGAICAWFQQQAREGGVRVRPELRIRVAETRVRIPDVALLDRSLSQEPVPVQPPVAVFEVVSSDDKLSKLAERCADYERMGSGPFWCSTPKGRPTASWKARCNLWSPAPSIFPAASAALILTRLRS